MVLSGVATASDKDMFYKDWRLDKPFAHGFIVGISLGVAESEPANWNEALELEPSGIPSGLLPYILDHKVIPFRLGVTYALFFWVCFIASFVYRFSNRELYGRYISLVLAEKDNEYREKLLTTSQ